MTITLSGLPRLTQYRPRRITNGGDLKGPLGGPNLRLNRRGSRWALDVDVPPLAYADCAAEWLADLAMGEEELVRLAFPQPGMPTLSQGAPRVDGGGQLGRNLAVDGMPFGLLVGKGRFVNVTTGGRTRLHQLTATLDVPSNGKGGLSLWPELRFAPDDNDVVEFNAVVIEGHVEGDGSWTLGTASAGFSFSIVEPD